MKRGPGRCIYLLALPEPEHPPSPKMLMLLVWGWTFGLRLGIPLPPHNLPFPVFIWLVDQELYSESPSSPATDDRQRDFLVTIITWGESHNKSHDICPSICLSSSICQYHLYYLLMFFPKFVFSSIFERSTNTHLFLDLEHTFLRTHFSNICRLKMPSLHLEYWIPSQPASTLCSPVGFPSTVLHLPGGWSTAATQTH